MLDHGDIGVETWMVVVGDDICRNMGGVRDMGRCRNIKADMKCWVTLMCRGGSDI